MNPQQEQNPVQPTAQNPQQPVPPQQQGVVQPVAQPIMPTPATGGSSEFGQMQATPSKRHWLKFAVIGVVVVIALFVALVLFTIFNPSTGSWRDKYKTQFQNAGQKVTDDVATVSNDVVNQDATSLPNDCQQLKTDIATLQAIPAYPISATNDRLKSAEQSIAKGADDCLSGVNQQDVNLINQAGQEFQTGLQGLKSVIPIING